MKSESQSSVKAELRKKIKTQRSLITERVSSDVAIFEKFISLSEFKSAELVLCYAAADYEVDCDRIADYALKSNKAVAFPLCKPNSGELDYYKVSALSQLETGYYNIRAPKPDMAEKVTRFDNAIVVVPAICYDENGYRLGYGGGYYDRFLKNNSLFSVGLCYNTLMQKSLPIEKHDKGVNIIVTEKDIIRINSEANNG